VPSVLLKNDLLNMYQNFNYYKFKTEKRIADKMVSLRIIFSFLPCDLTAQHLGKFTKQGVLTIYKNHPVGNFRHKHETIKYNVAGDRITIKYIHIS